MTTTIEPAQDQTSATHGTDMTPLRTRLFPGLAKPGLPGTTRYGQSLSGADLTAEFMRLTGAEYVFGIPGGASLPLNDALTHAHGDGGFRYILTGHEQGAAFEAEGYAAATGRAGWCTGTSGPGATNLITGLADAFRDSRPVIALTGNTATTAEPEAFQAIDIVSITHGKATKASFRPERPEEVQPALVAAYHAAMIGRPGSVLVDFPKDIQIKPSVMRPWEEFIARHDWSTPQASDEQIRQLADLLASADRPVLYCGHGCVIDDATEAIRTLSHRYNIPVVTTVHGLGILATDDTNNFGMIGMHGTVVANIAPFLADVTVALGARFDDRVVGARPAEFSPDATLVHVDIDSRQLNRVRPVNLAIHAGVRDTILRVLAALESRTVASRNAWHSRLAELRTELPFASYDDATSEELSHEWVYAEMTSAITDNGRHLDEVVATFDVGTHQMKGAQWFPATQPRSWITSGGMGSMACALPLAVGAAYGRPDATIIACVGDGGFVMSSHELDTIGAYQVPVKIILFDDAALGMVTNWHGLFFEGRDMTSERRRGRTVSKVDVVAYRQMIVEGLNRAETADDLANVLASATNELAHTEWPLFTATAAGYGIPAERVHSKEAFREAVRRMFDMSGPYMIQVMLPTKNQVYPLMEPGTTPQDLVWKESSPGSGVRVYVKDVFDYASGQMKDSESRGPASARRDDIDLSVV
ncbi:MAG: thiamine pyrophosphate-binding protein [Chloroflexi bacterium]|nr:thiamine pyrophosphate-binding protein [Chloroflexota bacterium]